MIWWRCCWCWWCCWWFVIHWWWSGLLTGSATPAGIASRGESGWLALGWINRRRKCWSSYIMINATHGLYTTINIWYMTLVYIWSIFNNQTKSYTKNCCSRWQLYPTQPLSAWRLVILHCNKTLRFEAMAGEAVAASGRVSTFRAPPLREDSRKWATFFFVASVSFIQNFDVWSQLRRPEAFWRRVLHRIA